MPQSVRKLIIIGSGPAGLTAGIYAARANLQPLIIEGAAPGGQLIGTTAVENWPGEKSILGPDLMKNMRAHAQSLGCEFMSGDIIATDFSHRPLRITTNKQISLTAHAIIVATGATPKRLGCPGENEYWGKGVTTCAVCDGALYKNLPVVIVGGGDTAMEDASFMKNFTNKITIVQHGPALTASYAMQQRVLHDPAITIIYNSTVTQIQGDGSKISSVTISTSDGKQQQLPTSALFIAIGLRPNTAPFTGQLPLKENGYLILTDHTKTSVSGVFGAGDVADSRYRQAITSAGSGCMAALDAEKYLASLNL